MYIGYELKFRMKGKFYCEMQSRLLIVCYMGTILIHPHGIPVGCGFNVQPTNHLLYYDVFKLDLLCYTWSTYIDHSGRVYYICSMTVEIVNITKDLRVKGI